VMPTHNGIPPLYIPATSYRTITFGQKTDDKPKGKSEWASVCNSISGFLIALAIIAVAVALIDWLQDDKKGQAVQENSQSSTIVAQLKVSPPPAVASSSISYPATLAKVCKLNVEVEPSVDYEYPPTGGPPNLYYKKGSDPKWEGIVRLDSGGIVTTAYDWMHPSEYPPYFGQCNAAKAAFSAAAQACAEAANHNLSHHAQFCRLKDIYGFVYSVALQLEYRALHLDFHFGTKYLFKVLNERVEFDDGLNPSNRSMRSLFRNTTDSMLDILDTHFCCSTCQRLNAGCSSVRLNIALVGPVGFNQHTGTAFDNLRSTVEDSNSALQTLNVEDYRYYGTLLLRGSTTKSPGNGLYPEYFDLCLASRKMFDYMLQNPFDRYPGGLSRSMDRMFRCSEPGAQILQAMSKILQWEYEVSKDYRNNKTLCPYASEVKAILDKTSLLISRSSEFQYGIMGVLIEKQGGEVYQAPPTTTGTVWLPGNDVYVIQWYWINFIVVHVAAIEGECNMGQIHFRNPFGFGYKQNYTTTDEYIRDSMANMSKWDSFDGSQFTKAQYYRAYVPGDMYSELLDYNGDVYQSILNDRTVGPRENEQMADKYPLYERYESTIYDRDDVMQPKFDEVYKDCTQYDPLGYVQQFFALDGPIDKSSTLNFFSMLANLLPISYTNLTVDGSKRCTDNVIECLWKFCDLRFGGILNPFNDYLPYAGDYETTKTFTMSHMAAPFCIEFNHSATIDRCASLWPKPPLQPPPQPPPQTPPQTPLQPPQNDTGTAPDDGTAPKLPG